MKILEVIPIAKGIPSELLTYFSSKEVREGTLVTVPLRRRNIPALVIGMKDVEDVKMDVKTARYELKSIISSYGTTPFFPEFIKACQRTKDFFVTTTGSIIGNFIPSFIFDEYLTFDRHHAIENEPLPPSNILPEKFAFQAAFGDRIEYYRTYIRQQFAKKESLFICLPIIADIELFERELSKGIEERLIVLHSGLTKKMVKKNYEAALTKEQAVVIIATPLFLFIPRQDITSIILEKEGSPHYKRDLFPFIDARYFIEEYAKLRNYTLFLGDEFLRVETVFRVNEREIRELHPLSFRLLQKRNVEVLHLDSKESTEPSKEKNKKSDFSIFSPELRKFIEEGIKKNEHIFLFTARKGLAPITVCEDCGSVLRSPNSGVPLVLFSEKKEGEKSRRIYKCPKTNEIFSAIDRCPTCTGWRLKMLGIGSETVDAELAKEFPDKERILVDADTTKTHQETKKALEYFYTTPGSILVGTEKVVPYLSEQIPRSAIVSIDSLFAVPSFMIHEKILRTLFTIAQKSEHFFIQTRNASEKILDTLKKGNVIDFYTNELKERKQFRYPPFSVLVKVSREVATKERPVLEKKLLTLFEAYAPAFFPSHASKKGMITLNMLFKVEPKEWKEQKNELREKLSSLPMDYIIRVNPDALV